jgi:flagellum-specific ATP synthase
VDRAIVLNPALETFLSQDPHDATGLDDSFARLGQILSEAA